MKKFEFELSCLLSFGNDCYSHLTVRLEHFKQSKKTCLLLPHSYPWHLDEFSCVMMRDSWDTIITTAKATATIWKITPKFTVARKRYTKKFFDELNSDDQRLQDPELSVKTHIFWQS